MKSILKSHVIKQVPFDFQTSEQSNVVAVGTPERRKTQGKNRTQPSQPLPMTK